MCLPFSRKRVASVLPPASAGLEPRLWEGEMATARSHLTDAPA